jgi:HD-like signal output (HDOD) protein
MKAPDVDYESVFEQEFTLPPLPEVAAKLLEQIADDRASVIQIATLISADVGLSARVLQLVNSAYYSLARTIRDVKTAVGYVGLAQIQRLVVMSSVMQALTTKNRDEQHKIWYHSYYTALAAKCVARRFEPTLEPDELYAASLLHDIGQLVYLKFFPDDYRNMTAFAKKEGRFLVDAERHFERPSHLVLGGMLCEQWGLPDVVKQACEVHELDQLQATCDLHPIQKVTGVSNLLVHLAESQLEEDLKREVQTCIQNRLGCSDQDFLTLIGDVYNLKTEVGRFLDEL